MYFGSHVVSVSWATVRSVVAMTSERPGATTSLPALLQGLAALQVPKLFLLIAAFMHRYLFVIAGETARMRSALAARAYDPRHALRAGALGRLATAMFLRSFDRGERVYLAMLARGYRGELPSLRVLAFGRAEALFVVAVLAAPLALRAGLAVA